MISSEGNVKGGVTLGKESCVWCLQRGRGGLKVIWPWENADDTEVSREFIEWNGFRSLR